MQSLLVVEDMAALKRAVVIVELFVVKILQRTTTVNFALRVLAVFQVRCRLASQGGVPDGNLENGRAMLPVITRQEKWL